MTPTPSRLLTLRPRDVEEEFGIAEQTLANWRSTGRGPAFIRVSPRLVLYQRSEIAKWLAARRVRTTR